MSDDEIKEGNELIAMFLEENQEGFVKIKWNVRNKKFDISWDWLMPVFEKISKIDHLFLSMQLGGYTTISINEQDDDLKYIVLEKTSHYNENHFEFMYKYAIEFIKMYNNIYLKNNNCFWSLEDLKDTNETN